MDARQAQQLPARRGRRKGREDLIKDYVMGGIGKREGESGCLRRAQSEKVDGIVQVGVFADSSSIV